MRVLLALLCGACAGGQGGTDGVFSSGLGSSVGGPGGSGAESGDSEDTQDSDDEDSNTSDSPNTSDASSGSDPSETVGPPGGCVVDDECDDGDPCTSDVCNDDGTCGNEAMSCDDANDCTADSCDPTMGCVNASTAAPGSQAFAYSGGAQTFVVPACVLMVRIEAYGAQGGNGDGSIVGGLGGYAAADVPVTPGESLEVHVGGAGMTVINAVSGGYNGGGGSLEAVSQGIGDSGTGGGASDVRRGGALEGRLVVAGGGGGGGWSSRDGHGGDGGGLNGEDGSGNSGVYLPGGGGTQSSGGAVGWAENEYTNQPGAFGFGGTAYHDGAGCGGGGGGWYGGGTGGFSGGGGGSSYVDAAGNENTETTAGVQSGNGAVTITW